MGFMIDPYDRCSLVNYRRNELEAQFDFFACISVFNLVKIFNPLF